MHNWGEDQKPKYSNLVRVYRNISRNDICPCLSGRKIKQCDCGFIEKMDDMVDLTTSNIMRGQKVIGKLTPKE